LTTDNFCFYLQIRLIQTSQTGGQWYSDTSPFSIPCCTIKLINSCNKLDCLSLWSTLIQVIIRSLPKWSHLWDSTVRVGSKSCSQILHLGGSDWQWQHSSLLQRRINCSCIKFYIKGPWDSTLRVGSKSCSQILHMGGSDWQWQHSSLFC